MAVNDAQCDEGGDECGHGFVAGVRRPHENLAPDGLCHLDLEGVSRRRLIYNMKKIEIK